MFRILRTSIAANNRPNVLPTIHPKNGYPGIEDLFADELVMLELLDVVFTGKL